MGISKMITKAGVNVLAKLLGTVIAVLCYFTGPIVAVKYLTDADSSPRLGIIGAYLVLFGLMWFAQFDNDNPRFRKIEAELEQLRGARNSAPDGTKP